MRTNLGKYCLFIIVFAGFFGALFSQPLKDLKFPQLQDFITDTLYIEVAPDTGLVPTDTSLHIIDARELGGAILGIRQTKKWKVIPVDQYLAMDESLSALFTRQFSYDSLNVSGTLYISHLYLWYDGQQELHKGLCLNAYTTYYDSLNTPVSDWIWEIRVKREKKEKDQVYLGRVVKQLLIDQSKVLADKDFNPDFYPYLYRRQLLTWSEIIVFKDGYAINPHLTLDFPPDLKSKWERGSPGVFYRKSDIHESIAIGGKNQIWYWRLSPSWITKTSATFRFGFNNFEGGHFDHLAYQNFLYVNVSGQTSIEYLPIYHKGLFGGLGIYTGYSFLPDVIPQAELGFLMSVGILLP